MKTRLKASAKQKGSVESFVDANQLDCLVVEVVDESGVHKMLQLTVPPGKGWAPGDDEVHKPAILNMDGYVTACPPSK